MEKTRRCVSKEHVFEQTEPSNQKVSFMCLARTSETTFLMKDEPLYVCTSFAYISRVLIEGDT
jgi:hypothetical protein